MNIKLGVIFVIVFIVVVQVAKNMRRRNKL